MSIEQILEYVAKVWGSIQHFIAGFIGASIVAYYLRDQIKTKLEFTIFIVSGGFIAHYLTQFTVFILGRFGWVIEAPNVGSIGFLLGAFGGLIIQQVVSYIVSGAWKEISFRRYIIEAIKEAWTSRGKK